MLGLWLWWLEWAGEDAHLGVLDFLVHLGVREFFVEDDSFNELGIFDGSSGLLDDFDQIKVDIFSLHVSDVEDSLHSEVSVEVLAGTDDLGAEGGLGTLS